MFRANPKQRAQAFVQPIKLFCKDAGSDGLIVKGAVAVPAKDRPRVFA
jgi:hypothetical protein